MANQFIFASTKSSGVVHGDIDDNVTVENDALRRCIDEGEQNFDMLIAPNMYHGEGGNSYLVRRRRDYFVRNLLGVTQMATRFTKIAKTCRAKTPSLPG